jgi:hypothetical protein
VPWIVPSHQAPALLLKLWRPRWFSGLALVLGTMAPDLEFILRLDGECFVSHTLLGQIYFTLPVVILLYWLSVVLVIPWLLPYLPEGPPFHWHDLAALRPPTGLEWFGVAASGIVGGLTHIALDGFTHGDRSGWAVALFPTLSVRLPLPRGEAPLYEVLQIVLTVLLGVAALELWGRMARGRLLWFWRGEAPCIAPFAPIAHRRRMARWLLGCAAAGVVLALGLRPLGSVWLAVERAAYGALTFFALGLLLGAAADRVVRAPRWRARGSAGKLPMVVCREQLS